MGVIKGQFFRVLIDEKVVALAKSCTLHTAADVSDTTTKDSTGMWKEQEVTAMSWDGSVNGLVAELSTSETANQGLNMILSVGTMVAIEFEQTTGDENRVAKAGGVKFSGNAIINDCSAEFPDRADSTFTLQFQGTGALTKSTIPTPPTGGES